jgi:hypothetical protein
MSSVLGFVWCVAGLVVGGIGHGVFVRSGKFANSTPATKFLVTSTVLALALLGWPFFLGCWLSDHFDVAETD